MSDFLDKKRQEIAERLAELKPAIDEYERLKAAVSALAGIGGSTATRVASTVAPGLKKGPGRPRGSRKRARKATRASTPAATAAVTAEATPAVVERKKAGRPKGTGKKVGRPRGSGKK